MRIRVLWLVKGLGRGGAERLIMEMAPKLDPERFELEVAYVLPWKDAFAAPLRSAGIPVYCLRGHRTADPVWVLRLAALLRQRRYDVVHTHSPVPAVVARLVAPRSTRFVHTEHNVWDAYRPMTRLANAVTYARNDQVWAVSNGVAATIAKPRWVPFRSPTVSTMLHGVAVNGVPRGTEARVRARGMLGIDADVPVIGTVANLTLKKDPATLLAAVDLVRSDVPDVVLCLIGAGPLETSLRDDVAARGLDDHVRFLGSRDDVPELLPGFDVFALSSRYEGLGLSLLEAMAAGVACVSTDVGGVPEVITDGVNGRLIPTADATALAAALRQVLTDGELREAMVVAGRERVSESFASLDHVVRASELLYADMGQHLATRPPTPNARCERQSESRVRVLWLIKGLGLGGAERLLTLMATRLNPERFELEVAYVLPWKDAFVAELRDAGVRVHCLGARRTLDPRWMWRLTKLLRRGRFDVVHTHSPVPAAVARLVADRSTRLVHTEHNVWERYRWPTRLANSLTYGRNAAALGVSEGVTDSVVPPRWSLGQPPAMQTLRHGVDADAVPHGPKARAAARRRIGLSEAAAVVGSVANFTPKKDQATLLAAVDLLRATVPDVVLCLIGSGPLEAALRADVDRRGLQGHVRFLGSRDDVPELLPAFDVFTLSSRYEGLPISMLEAMAAEVACVVTAVGGIPEAVEDGVGGLLVPPGDAQALADGLAETLCDTEFRIGLAEAGRRRIREEFSIDRAMRVSEDLYASLVGP